LTDKTLPFSTPTHLSIWERGEADYTDFVFLLPNLAEGGSDDNTKILHSTKTKSFYLKIQKNRNVFGSFRKGILMFTINNLVKQK